LIKQECRRLSALIENVLDVCRNDQGRKEYVFEPTDAVALVGETVKSMQPCGLERHVTLAAALPQKSALVRADGPALRQALINLIDNAIKHSPDGAVVTVGLEVEAACPSVNQPATALRSGPTWRLWVEDQGEGIPPEEHDRIFERFYRCGSELRRETQGIGLGLAIVKHVAEAHGGKVTVRSAVGAGSRFTMEFPS
jgi:signal transduction histidine kinase